MTAKSARMPRMKRIPAAVLLMFYTACACLVGVTDLPGLMLPYAAFSASLLAAVAFMFRRRYIAFFPPLAAILAFAATGSWLLAAASLLTTVLPAAAIAWSFYNDCDNKARAVTLTSAAFAAAVLLLLGLYLLKGGSIPRPDDAVSRLTAWFASVKIPGKDGLTPIFKAEAASGLANYVVVCLPAFAAVAVSALSFASVSLFLILADIFFFNSSIDPEARSYKPTAVSAAVYIASYLVSSSLIYAPSADVIGYAAENLLLIILPAMMIWGEKTLYRISVEHEKVLVFVILTVILLMASPSVYLMAVSFTGAISLILGAVMPRVRRFISRMRRDMFGDDDSYDDYDDYDGEDGDKNESDDYCEYPDDGRYGRRDGGDYDEDKSDKDGED